MVLFCASMKKLLRQAKKSMGKGMALGLIAASQHQMKWGSLETYLFKNRHKVMFSGEIN